MFELFWLLLGGVCFFKSAVNDAEKRNKNSLDKAWIASITDKELESKLWNDIHDPAKYNEIWERIENYKKKANGVYLNKSAWKDIGERRYAFFNRNGRATNDLEGNRQYGLLLLMETYGKLPLGTAILRLPLK